jgi:hypothetical protein
MLARISLASPNNSSLLEPHTVNLLYSVNSMILSMNKLLLETAIVLVFASALIMIGSDSMQSAHACSSTAAQNANPNTPSTLNTKLPAQPTSAAVTADQTA